MCFYRITNLFHSIIIKNSLKHKKPYIIIPFGTYCLPRVITTLSRIKAKKAQGEKSFPFDLAFFNNIDANIDFLDNNFKDFFNNINYDKKREFYVNNEKNIVFNHDSSLSFEDFTQRYKNRIKNLYDALSQVDKHIYILIASWETITETQVEKLKNILKRYQKDDNYDIIIINQSIDDNLLKIKNLYVINQGYNYDNFKFINKDGNWVGNLKKLKLKAAQKFYYDIVYKLLKIIH